MQVHIAQLQSRRRWRCLQCRVHVLHANHHACNCITHPLAPRKIERSGRPSSNRNVQYSLASYDRTKDRSVARDRHCIWLHRSFRWRPWRRPTKLLRNGRRGRSKRLATRPTKPPRRSSRPNLISMSCRTKSQGSNERPINCKPSLIGCAATSSRSLCRGSSRAVHLVFRCSPVFRPRKIRYRPKCSLM